MSPGCLEFLLLRYIANVAEQELWVASEIWTALGCVGECLGPSVCVDINTTSPEQGCLFGNQDLFGLPYINIFGPY